MAGADTARSDVRTVGESRPPEPPAISRALVSIRLRAADLLDTVSGRRDRLTPPRRLSLYVGHGDFRATGEEFLGLFETVVDLRPERPRARHRLRDRADGARARAGAAPAGLLRRLRHRRARHSLVPGALRRTPRRRFASSTPTCTTASTTRPDGTRPRPTRSRTATVRSTSRSRPPCSRICCPRLPTTIWRRRPECWRRTDACSQPGS